MCYENVSSLHFNEYKAPTHPYPWACFFAKGQCPGGKSFFFTIAIKMLWFQGQIQAAYLHSAVLKERSIEQADWGGNIGWGWLVRRKEWFIGQDKWDKAKLRGWIQIFQFSRLVLLQLFLGCSELGFYKTEFLWRCEKKNWKRLNSKPITASYIC